MTSFDVFDTLITRVTKDPYGIFCIMQERLKLIEDERFRFLVNDFAKIRVMAEKNAGFFIKNENEKKELDLEFIYRVLMKMTGISEDTKNALKELEIQIEVECAVGIKSNISLLKELYLSGERVILISDMYLSSEAIRKILVSIDDIFENIAIYVSNECGCSKRLGGLFLYVRKKENVDKGSWTHYGDNRLSDVDNPQDLGIKAIWCKNKELLSWEMEIENGKRFDWNVSWQLCVGISRVIRQNNRISSNEEIGTSFAGIVLYSYVEWVIRNSIQQGIDTLYFVARDGYILKIIADIIISNYKFKIKTKYIFGSRMAWRVRNASKEVQERLYCYLKQEINFSERIAFVEVNGTGYTMECLAEIIEKISKQTIYVYYYTLKKNIESGKCVFLTYLTEDEEIIEVLCRAPHGTTMGYINKDSKIYPEIREVDKAIWEKAGLLEYIQGIKLFTEEMSRILTRIGLFVGDRCLIKEILANIIDNPDKTILNFLANIPHNDSSKDEEIYAPGLSWKDLFNIFMWRTTEDLNVYYKGANMEYSKSTLSERDKKIMRFYEKNYYRLFGKIIHFYKKIKVNYKKYLLMQGLKNRVIVYGAGGEGRKIYQYLFQETNYKLVAWIDKNCLEYQKMGYPVVGLGGLVKKRFDVLIIAVKNNELRNYIKEILIEKGIDSEKIVFSDEIRNIIQEAKM